MSRIDLHKSRRIWPSAVSYGATKLIAKKLIIMQFNYEQLLTMKIRNIFIILTLCLGLCACVGGETNYKVAKIYLGRIEGVNVFSQGDVNIVADDNYNMTNTGSSQVEFAFVKDLVYRLSMVNKIPKDGWTDTIEHINLQDGYVGRLLLDDGTYEYCRFCVHTLDYDMNADQYILFKYQSDFKTK